MGLQKLILHDFKSYAGRLEIPFDGTPFVAIVGLNGSGKSNMLDAICFVIGMDTNHLRGVSTKELVHNGSKPSDMFVSAVVRSDSDGSDAEESVNFKRTASEFFVNGAAVDEDTYKTLWSRTGVFPDARNCIVLQGDIENVAGAQPSNLAKMIEDMAGVSQAKLAEEREQYESVEHEIETRSKETRKRATKRRAAQAEVDQTLEISNARERLAELRHGLKKLERRRKQLVLLEKRALLDEMRQRSEQAQAQLEARRTEAELINADSRKLRTEYARKRRQLLNARNSEVEAQEAVTAAEAECAPLDKKQETIETEQRLLEPDLAYAEQFVTAAEAEVASADNALKLLDRSHDREQSREQPDASDGISKEVQDLWNKLENEFMTETALDQDALDTLKRQSDFASQKWHAKERRVEDLNAELNTMESRVKQRELRVQNLKALSDERKAQQQQRRNELSEVADELLSLRNEHRELTAKLRELSEKVRTSDGNKRALAQRHRLLDAVERLRRSQKGKVHDLLGNLVEPTETRFAEAVEKGLGSYADAIVVSDSDTAIECVSQARKERMGNLCFLPLSDLRTRDITAARSQLASQNARRDGSARLILDCCKFDPSVRPAVVYALGDSVLAATFAEGLKLRQSGLRMRIIDTHGSTLAANNIVSASSSSDGSTGTASDRMLASMQRKAHNIAERLKVASARETELCDREMRLNGQIDRATQTIQGAENELRIAEEYHQTAVVEADHLKEVLAKETEILAQHHDAAEAAQLELRGFMTQITSKREQKFEPFLSNVGGTLAEWDARFLRGAQRYAEFARQRQRLEDRLQLATDRRDTAVAQFSRQKKRSEALQAALERVLDHKSRMESELSAARHKLERAQSRVRTLRSETEAKSDEVGTAESAVDAARVQVAEAEQEEHRHSLALAAEIGEEQAELNANSDSESLESGESDVGEKEVRSRKRRQNPRRSTKSSGKETLSIDRLDAKIKDLKAEMEPLVQLASLFNSAEQDENASKASQRYDDLNQSVEADRSHLNELVTKFAVLKEKRASRFKQTLALLQDALSSVYTELVGGDAQARLTPVNNDEPFDAVEFVVMPPGKPFTPVAQLSGGERSMAALALVFASQRLHPAPFVVLDEVDAALDFVNVASVSRYVKLHSIETQFVIVSLKQRLFQTASHLVGVYKNPEKQSQVLTVPL